MPTSAQPRYSLLVANFSRPTQSLIWGADTANMAPTKTRTGFTFQCIERLGFAARLRHATYGPGRSLVAKAWPARLDPFGGTPPPTGEVTIANNAFAGTSASLFVGPYELVSNRDFMAGAVSGEPVVVAPPFNGALTVFTANLAVTPITPGTVAITTSPGVGSENFTDPAADGILVGSGGGSGTVDYNTGAVGLTYFAPPAAGLTVSADYGASDVTATNLAAAISNLPGYTGTAVGADVTVDGPLGQEGLRFEAAYRGGARNFTFTYVAEDGVLSQGIGGGPIEPPTILPAGVPNGVAP